MVVVEGPDGAGKTTLVKTLLDRIPTLELQPRVVTKDAEAMVDLKVWVEEDLAKGFGPRLYDRHRLISEPIYGPILRGDMEPGFDDTNWLSHKFRAFARQEPVLIFCLPPWEEVGKNILKSRDEQPVKMHMSDAQSIYWLYRMEACRWQGCWIHNYLGTKADLGIDTLVKHIQRRLNLPTEAEVANG